jgi:hypothetical protein
MAGTDPIPEQIDEMIRTWGERAALPFHGAPRSPQVEQGLRMTILLAFQAVESSLPQLKGSRFGFVWDEANRISVKVAPKDELTEEMLIIKVGDPIHADGAS